MRYCVTNATCYGDNPYLNTIDTDTDTERRRDFFETSNHTKLNHRETEAVTAGGSGGSGGNTKRSMGECIDPGEVFNWHSDDAYTNHHRHHHRHMNTTKDSYAMSSLSYDEHLFNTVLV